MSSPRLRFQSTIFLPLLSVACLLLSGLASATPSITLSRKTGPPTSRILVSGRGFGANVIVDIYVGPTYRTQCVTDKDGNFSDIRISVPRESRPGIHSIRAVQQPSGGTAKQPFLVRTNWSQFHFDANGRRVNPYENVLDPKTVGRLKLKWK